MNLTLGRAVLGHVTAHREQFAMAAWGDPACGTTACLGGWAMLLSGYELAGYEDFRRPDGTRVMARVAESARLLGLGGDDIGVFFESDEDAAIAAFRALLEAAGNA